MSSTRTRSIARYRQTLSRVGLNVGVNLGARSDVRVGAYVGRTTASIEVGDPGFPELQGKETGAEIVWRLDTQDSPVVPSRGRAVAGPAVAHLQQSRRRRWRDETHRLRRVADAAVGEWQSVLERRSAQSRVRVRRRSARRSATLRCRPDQFALGHAVQARRLRRRARLSGPHYYVATGGYLRQVGRLPDFMGGPSSRAAGSRTATPSTTGRVRAGEPTAASAS